MEHKSYLLVKNFTKNLPAADIFGTRWNAKFQKFDLKQLKPWRYLTRGLTYQQIFICTSIQNDKRK